MGNKDCVLSLKRYCSFRTKKLHDIKVSSNILLRAVSVFFESDVTHGVPFHTVVVFGMGPDFFSNLFQLTVHG